MSRGPRVLRALLALVLLGSVLATGHVARAHLGGLRGPDVVGSQVAFLDDVAPSQAPQMQQYFPEGAFFTWALTGMAAGNLALAGHDVEAHRAVLARAVLATGTPEMAATFGHIPELEHGAFYRGWRLHLLTMLARLTSDPDQIARVGVEALEILRAVDASATGLVNSYPRGAWPCDVVVAMAGVHEASRLTTVIDLDDATSRWLERMKAHRDPRSGLLVHQRGDTLPRGSSQSIITAFLPLIDRSAAESEWAGFREHFLVAEAGLIGLREWPIGQSGPGDVDSGPLVLGVSASASAVALAGARANGDLDVATNLDREAELLGLPLILPGSRRFAFGVMPVGDAFVAWARSVPTATMTASLTAPPSPLWPLWYGLAVVPGLLAGWGLQRRQSRQNSLPSGSARTMKP